MCVPEIAKSYRRAKRAENSFENLEDFTKELQRKYKGKSAREARREKSEGFKDFTKEIQRKVGARSAPRKKFEDFEDFAKEIQKKSMELKIPEGFFFRMCVTTCHVMGVVCGRKAQIKHYYIF